MQFIREDRSRGFVLSCLSLLVLYWQVCFNCAYADSPAQDQPVANGKSEQQTKLNGHVSSFFDNTDQDKNAPKKLESEISDQGDQKKSLLPEDAKNDTATPRIESHKFPIHIRKSKMTPEDYRNLQYGILGIVSTKSIFSRNYTISELLPDCPAALAGMQAGDVEIGANDHLFSREEGQREYWQITGGKAGTPVDVIVRRHGKLITFHLIRMNIEDIQNNHIRRMYERMLSKLGAPAGQ